ncbi:pyridoxine 5'-phosphate synthase [Flavobacteriaceae bacterium]|jgi:pyridoxine 5-phosphate synthase|nr:pyridoxine 5'-phosphate synthase [Flavobacteriaceae bacterium]MDA8626396.1 pyridoxine 5'-phosphate synthase [Flavobacteriaceae bacterium]MDA9550512.1 pyridoxine 5'-phosphate synthase [Flavobacteriaceae bacterium]MDA9849755.1 pyridoxine 5'-phosphate synthase [Flavobacteriaceae bacterium]MDB2321407.1 pyridoxine 5'-phosphate synthase [Flavobacteriaceae bacterium]|tara:strand:+ start:454 stop:1167 length:714 start_codon:yes stop_codon:yes gene_type:complete
MTKLSVNINKIATLRNARGGNTPNLLEFAKKIQMFGAQGITVHPRPDERHIRYSDVYDLLPIVNTEFNIEGNPNEKFIKMVLEIKPTQVTLVPDGVNDITSSSGWNTIKNESFLTEIVGEFKRNNIRTSIFLNPELKFIENLHKIGTDRIELYTEDYAINYKKGNYTAIDPYVDCAKLLNQLDIGVNAGHDLSLENIEFFKKKINNLLEVSIGHALITESLILGLEPVIKSYLQKLS